MSQELYKEKMNNKKNSTHEKIPDKREVFSTKQSQIKG